jgi:hypothetical protein
MRFVKTLILIAPCARLIGMDPCYVAHNASTYPLPRQLHPRSLNQPSGPLNTYPMCVTASPDINRRNP